MAATDRGAEQEHVRCRMLTVTVKAAPMRLVVQGDELCVTKHFRFQWRQRGEQSIDLCRRLHSRRTLYDT